MTQSQLKRLTGRITRSARFRYDRRVVPGQNARMNAAFERDPDRVLDRVDAALDRAMAWLDPQIDVSTSVLLCASRTYWTTGDARFAFYRDKAEHYRTTIRDPALRIVLPDYDPESPEYAHLPDVMDVRPYVPVELLMIDTLWCDVHPKGDIIGRLTAFDDDGFYGTTHIIVGGFLLLDNGGAPEDRVRAMMDAAIPSVAARNRITSQADDIYAERCMVLQWMNRHDLVEPAWIMRLLDSQRDDGGWGAPNMPPVNESNQHTVAVATAALGAFLDHHRATKH